MNGLAWIAGIIGFLFLIGILATGDMGTNVNWGLAGLRGVIYIVLILLVAAAIAAFAPRS